jgi:hypothetical protein
MTRPLVALDRSGERRGRRWKRALRLGRRFFWSTHKFPTQRRAIPWEISLRNVKGHESGARSELTMGNGWLLGARKQRLFPRPLPIIGVRRVIMQCRAHDNAHRTAPLKRGGYSARSGAHDFRAPLEWRAPMKVFFQGAGDRWTRGLLARNPCAIGIQPVHSRVDSCGLPPRGDSTKSNFALDSKFTKSPDGAVLWARRESLEA